jgi:hypothetical protein
MAKIEPPYLSALIAKGWLYTGTCPCAVKTDHFLLDGLSLKVQRKTGAWTLYKDKTPIQSGDSSDLMEIQTQS